MPRTLPAFCIFNYVQTYSLQIKLLDLTATVQNKYIEWFTNFSKILFCILKTTSSKISMAQIKVFSLVNALISAYYNIALRLTFFE